MGEKTSQLLADLRRQLAELDGKRPRLMAAIEALEALDLPAVKLVAPPKVAKERPGKAETPVSIADAAVMVLRELGGPMSATDLWTAINDLHVLGRPIKRTSLVSALDAKYHEKQMFTKPEPGVYALMNGNGR